MIDLLFSCLKDNQMLHEIKMMKNMNTNKIPLIFLCFSSKIQIKINTFVDFFLQKDQIEAIVGNIMF